MANDPEEMRKTMLRNLESKTGKSEAEWVAIVGRSGLEKHGARVAYLKQEHGMTHGYANLIVHIAKGTTLGSDAADGPSADSVFSGSKAGLRPIFDTLAKLIETFGDDVEFAPKKAYISIRRATQFALIQPSTKTRVDLGIKLRTRAPQGRLEASGSFNSMVTHRVRLASTGDVDAELADWLKQAYSEASG